MKFAFFGSSQFSIHVLNDLQKHGMVPALIVTAPDKPKGRGLLLTPNPVKIWAQNHKIEVLEPTSLRDRGLVSRLETSMYQFFLVASYGRIIPPDIFNIPKFKTLNFHPSLLPRYRGASPIKSQILANEQNLGVSVMVIDEGLDTGPILGQRKISEKLSFPSSLDLEKILAAESVKLFTEVLPKWLQGEIAPKPQNSALATTCHKIKKEDGRLNLNDDPVQNLLKIKAFADWPRAYFFAKRGGRDRRIIVTDAKIKDNQLQILKVIPEGKKEIPYEDFLRGQR
jgi:methionyl-tRNA formyltransferase